MNQKTNFQQLNKPPHHKKLPNHPKNNEVTPKSTPSLKHLKTQYFYAKY